MKWPVVTFDRLHHMDEVVVVDKKGMAFFGPLQASANLARVKTDDEIVDVSSLEFTVFTVQVTSTDCPAQILLAARKSVLQADIRSNQKHLDTLFTVPQEAEKTVMPLSQEEMDFLNQRELIQHMKCADPGAELFLFTTFQRIYAVDRRMPGTLLFHMNHLDVGGGEFVKMVRCSCCPLNRYKFRPAHSTSRTRTCASSTT